MAWIVCWACSAAAYQLNTSGRVVKVVGMQGAAPSTGNDTACMDYPDLKACATIHGGVAAAQKAGIYTVVLLEGTHRPMDYYNGSDQVGTHLMVQSPLAIVGHASWMAATVGSETSTFTERGKRPIINCEYVATSPFGVRAKSVQALLNKLCICLLISGCL